MRSRATYSSTGSAAASGEILTGSEAKPVRAKIEWGPTFVVPGELKDYLADCYEDSQCDEDNGQQCKLGKCSVKEGYCKKKEDCGEEEKCVVDECKPKDWCFIDVNCEKGEQCKEGKCVKTKEETMVDGVDNNSLYAGGGTVSIISISICCCCILLLGGLMITMKKTDESNEE